MKQIWMSEPTMQGIIDSMPPGDQLCPVCNGAGELGQGHGEMQTTEQCRRCRGNGTVRA